MWEREKGEELFVSKLLRASKWSKERDRGRRKSEINSLPPCVDYEEQDG
jgi:hypothetical protein